MTDGEKMADNKVRLQKFLSENGVASRRKSEELIERGKVKVNGHPASLGDKVDPRYDLVTVSGEKIVPARNSENVYTFIGFEKDKTYNMTVQGKSKRDWIIEGNYIIY